MKPHAATTSSGEASGADSAALPGGVARLELPPVFPSVVHMLDAAARSHPDACALVCGEERLSYREYAACVSGFAQELMQAGVGPGTRVALVMANSIDIAIATFAVQSAGAQVVAMNPAYTASELVPIFENADCIAIVHDAESAPVLESVATSFLSHRRFVLGASHRRLDAWRSRPELADSLPLPDPELPSTLQYTGGTTGRSKGVDLDHRAVSTNVSQREALVQTDPGRERVLVITPMFHSYALAMGLYLAAYSRSTLVILQRYKPEAVLQAIEQHRITILLGSPTIYVGLLACEALAGAHLGSLHTSVSGAAALPEETLKRWEAASGCAVCEGYGQSEAGPVLAFNPNRGLRKIASVGRIAPATEVEIVDVQDANKVLGVGEVGEIRARGPQVMRGYRGLPAESAEALRHGWLYTGDIGQFDADGYLYIRGRKKEMAIVGGFNVYPREVEEAIFTHPSIRDVAVIAVPDAYRGEALVAWVVGDGGCDAESLQAYLSGRLVKYKLPARFRFVDELPKTSVGKPDKVAMRTWHAAKNLPAEPL
ncbi:Long-chain acyl-CoA synthetase [Burkholderiales bacterium 8X]|nr:Long-chain acyl-CoA synthetase [Burkholderiales bacterium 8X]